MTKKLICKCENKFQDEIYGNHVRVHNQTKKADGTIYRRTVCGNENKGGKIEKEQ